MDLHRDDERIQLLGKLAIVKSILEAEQKSKLNIDPDTGHYDVNNLKETWFFDFAKNLTDGVRKKEIHRLFERVSLVIFNYDRCFEHFMFHALQKIYGIDESTASDVMSKLNIIHPYGTIGELPWQDKSGIPFGFKANRANMEFMAPRIRTYTEQIEKSQVLEAMRSAVFESDTMVGIFLSSRKHEAAYD